MPSIKRPYVFLAILIGCVVAIVLTRTQLLEVTLTTLLRDAGFSNINIDIERVETQHSRLAQIKFSLVNETDTLRVSAEDIQLNYSLAQLINGRVDSVNINTIIVHREVTANTPEIASPAITPQQVQTIIQTVKHSVAAYARFNTVSIQHMQLNGESFSAVQGLPLRLYARYDDNSLSIELSQLSQTQTANDAGQRRITLDYNGNLIKAGIYFVTDQKPVPAEIELKINDNEITGSYSVNIPQLQRWIQAEESINRNFIINKVSGTLSFNFNATDIIVSTITASTKEILFNQYRAEDLAVRLIINNSTDTQNQHIQLKKGSHIKIGKLSDNGSTLATTQLNLSGDFTATPDNNWKYKGDVSTGSIAFGIQPYNIKLKDAVATFVASQDSLAAHGRFSSAIIPSTFTFKFKHRLSSQVGQFSIDSLEPITLNPEKHKLSQLISPLPYPFDLVTGKINLGMDGVWSKKHDFKLTARVKIDDAGGHYDELLFSGLSLDHELELLPLIQSSHTGNITLKHLDSGVAVDNINTSLTVSTQSSTSKPRLSFQALRGEIFDGTFSSDNIIFDLNKPNNRFNVRLTNIDLAKVVETQQLEAIVVTGRVDGTIPVDIDEQGISIENGTLINDVRAGTIRYTPGAEAEQLKHSPLTGIALDALKDFRYSYLSAGINFTPAGLLTINLQLKGTSPELKTQRPVNLNINTEQNLAALFKSLRFAQGVSENIDKKVRLQYENKQNRN